MQSPPLSHVVTSQNTFADSETRSTPEALHRKLAQWTQKRLRPGFPELGWRVGLRQDAELALVEGEFLEEAQGAIKSAAADAPLEPRAFIQWFEALKVDGPGQGDPLFRWLAHDATLNQMRWFLRQEVAGEAGFDDLVALTQLRLPVRPKLELARNYWDEMGRGRELAMHGPMLERLSHALDLEPSMDGTVWESLALGNLLAGLAANRRYAYHALGALGAVELTAPGRAERVNEGMLRLGISKDARVYFALHATMDVKHSEAWNQEVLEPLVRDDPRTAVPLAEGALMRLAAGALCFSRYRRELGLTGSG